jgi:hypothetical protein
MRLKAPSIGQVATAAGVNVETIRYYQQRGLLEEPTKPLGGYRNYPPEMVKMIRFIKRAQALGFTRLGAFVKLSVKFFLLLIASRSVDQDFGHVGSTTRSSHKQPV